MIAPGVLESMASECCNPSVKEGAADESYSIKSIPIESTSEILLKKNPLYSFLGTELLEEGKQ